MTKKKVKKCSQSRRGYTDTTTEQSKTDGTAELYKTPKTIMKVHIAEFVGYIFSQFKIDRAPASF